MTDLGAISASIGKPIKLVLGRPLFEHAMVELDFDRSELLIDANGDDVPAGGDILPLRSTDGGALATMITLCGKTIDALYDLGSGDVTPVSHPAVTRVRR